MIALSNCHYAAVKCHRSGVAGRMARAVAADSCYRLVKERKRRRACAPLATDQVESLKWQRFNAYASFFLLRQINLAQHPINNILLIDNK